MHNTETRINYIH